MPRATCRNKVVLGAPASECARVCREETDFPRRGESPRIGKGVGGGESRKASVHVELRIGEQQYELLERIARCA